MHAVYFICILLKLLKKKERKEKRTLAHDHAVGDGARIQTFNTCALHSTPRGLNQFWRQRDLQNCLTVPGPTLPGSAALSTAPQLLDDLPSLSPSLLRQLQTRDSDLSRAPSSHHHAWPTSRCFLFPRPSPILHRRNIAKVEIQTSQSHCEHQVILGQGRGAVVHKVDTGVGCASLGSGGRSMRAASGHAHICGQSHAALPLRAGEGQGHCPNSNLVPTPPHPQFPSLIWEKGGDKCLPKAQHFNSASPISLVHLWQSFFYAQAVIFCLPFTIPGKNL